MIAERLDQEIPGILQPEGTSMVAVQGREPLCMAGNQSAHLKVRGQAQMISVTQAVVGNSSDPPHWQGSREIDGLVRGDCKVRQPLKLWPHSRRKSDRYQTKSGQGFTWLEPGKQPDPQGDRSMGQQSTRPPGTRATEQAHGPSVIRL
ncbi:unnamed protein product [Arctogadus glacialis]